jgi:uncharacterized protein
MLEFLEACMDKAQIFTGHHYVSVETFRKSGVGVRTPVWFAEKNGALYIYTLENSGKVKRLRYNRKVRIAPCDMRGNLLGEWIDGEARFLEAPETQTADELLSRKYRMKRLFDWTSRLRRVRRVYLALKPV